MLSKLLILLPGSQLTAFLIVLPFNGGARQIIETERLVFPATISFALTNLVLLSAPAIQPRLMPLGKPFALAFAFILGTNMVIAEVFGHLIGNIASGTIGTLIGSVWGVLPMYLKRKHGF